ncbi:MAG: hypothetical protein HYX68_05290 [Planctomycetes bacterium]|nr:hypothetical protein [Planctomycetota bacterium]
MKKLIRTLLGVGFALTADVLRADGPPALSSEQFEKLHRMIKPHRGEARWMEIDWYPNIWEARQKAAREGKPLFIWAGSGGAPAAGC